VQELMAGVASGFDGLRTGMVASVHVCGDLLSLKPHVHALAARGGWGPDGSWAPVPFVDERCAEPNQSGSGSSSALPGTSRWLPSRSAEKEVTFHSLKIMYNEIDSRSCTAI
jgi:hypothetical protein